MKIVVTSVYVDDQDKALAFYTNVLGFVKKTEIPLGQARWLTVVAPGDPDGTELLLEPDGCNSRPAPKSSLSDNDLRQLQLARRAPLA
jgi:catechol 2,3-dioxygenase-like lactoylglutathione lyase family enzyme